MTAKWDDNRQQAMGGNRREATASRRTGRSAKGGYDVGGRNAVLHYTVGDADVMEQPELRRRTCAGRVHALVPGIGKIASRPLTMLLIEDDSAAPASFAGTLAWRVWR